MNLPMDSKKSETSKDEETDKANQRLLEKLLKEGYTSFDPITPFLDEPKK